MSAFQIILLIVVVAVGGYLSYQIYRVAPGYRDSRELARRLLEELTRLASSAAALSTKIERLGSSPVFIVYTQDPTIGEASRTMATLSKSREGAGMTPPVPSEQTSAIKEITDGFLNSLQHHTDELAAASTRIGDDQRQFLKELGSALLEQQAQLEELTGLLKHGSASTFGGASIVPKVVTPAPSDTSHKSESSRRKLEVSERMSESGREEYRADRPPAPQAATEGLQGFRELRGWLGFNLQKVMRRSMTTWNDPSELLIDAPRELSITATVLDGKVLLISSKGHRQHLAVVLPGSYIGSKYYDWFEMPKGTNERVEGTTEPAIVEEQPDNGFRVINRGSLKQD